MARRGENTVKGEHSKGKRKKKKYRTVAVQIVTDTYMSGLCVGHMIMSGHVIVLCLIQHVTHHMIGQVSGHMFGHVAKKGLGGHVRVSQGHVVR